MALEKLRAKRDELFKQLQQVMTEIALHEVTENEISLPSPAVTLSKEERDMLLGTNQSSVEERVRMQNQQAAQSVLEAV